MRTSWWNGVNGVAFIVSCSDGMKDTFGKIVTFSLEACSRMVSGISRPMFYFPIRYVSFQNCLRDKLIDG